MKHAVRIISLIISFSYGINVCHAYEKLPDDDSKILQKYSIVHNGIKRSYYLYIPTEIGNDKLPLMIALHGGMGNGEKMNELTLSKFNILADKEKFIVVYPDGIGRNWNDGRKNMPRSYKAHNNNIDDVGFISLLIDTLIETKNVDSNRIYITGMSNGALMVHRLAIELSGKIAAAAAVCGNLPTDLKSIPQNKVSFMIINGTNDPLVPYYGGYVHFNNRKLGLVSSTQESLLFWLKNNKIQSEPVFSNYPDRSIQDSCLTNITSFSSEDNSTEVVLISIDGGGHTWPGAWQYFDENLIGKTCRDFDACTVIWLFCKKHSRHLN